MARLHEHQGKALLAERGLATPRGRVARTPDEAQAIARELGGPAVVKIQAWTTGRKAIGGVELVDSPAAARDAAGRMLGMKVGNFPVEMVLVEERVPITRELFVSLTISDAARGPVLLVSFEGGSGIEDRAGGVARLAVDCEAGVDAGELQAALEASSIAAGHHPQVAAAIHAIVRTAREIEARSLEVNPLAVTADDGVVAADCRVTIDDYAVFRHPELGIEIARELDHPPTELERVAYAVEQKDHRGTFYFARLPHTERDRLVGFHGAGGGGSMMSMDALVDAGFTPANFCDTSGNPSSAKVYAAARVILSQPGLVGYFGSGSGVASQEQFWSAYGLAKAFIEVDLAIPALIRLGGNAEDRAVEILEHACRHLPAKVEGRKKDDPPAACAARFAELVAEQGGRLEGPERRVPGFVREGRGDRHELGAFALCIDADNCTPATTQLVVEQSSGLLQDEGGRPVPAVGADELAKRDSELIACEIECFRAGVPVVFVDLPVPGLDGLTTESTEGHGGSD